MHSDIFDKIIAITNARSITKTDQLQALWSNYGSISRVYLEGAEMETVIAKYVELPEDITHPRGWNTPLSHQRKVRSYEVESYWYDQLAKRCDSDTRVPKCFGVSQSEGVFLMVLEDLDAGGFDKRKSQLTPLEMQPCLRWLAYFHARFMGFEDAHLWKTGTYWHLDTRPDEWQSLDDQALKEAAQGIDLALQNCPFQTLVHGDAKLANFCFSADGQDVAAVDFQYVGGGCGMKDLAYFIGSCLDERACSQYEQSLLDTYFSYLSEALAIHRPSIDREAVEAAWRPLFAFAWTDFHRFVKGWSPDHWKINTYSEQLAQQVIRELNR